MISTRSVTSAGSARSSASARMLRASIFTALAGFRRSCDTIPIMSSRARIAWCSASSARWRALTSRSTAAYTLCPSTSIRWIDASAGNSSPDLRSPQISWRSPISRARPCAAPNPSTWPRCVGAESLGQEHREVLPAHLVRRVAEDPLGAFVEEDDPLLVVHGDHGVGRDGQQAGEQLGRQRPAAWRRAATAWLASLTSGIVRILVLVG